MRLTRSYPTPAFIREALRLNAAYAKHRREYAEAVGRVKVEIPLAEPIGALTVDPVVD